MDSTSVIQLIIIILLLFGSAFFSSAETALITVNRIQVQLLADEGDKRAKKVLWMLDRSGNMLSTILIGNNIVNIAASSLVTMFTIRVIGNTFVGVATGILTVLVLLFGEITPKSLATVRSLKISLAYAYIVWGLMIVLTPIVFVIEKIKLVITAIFHIDPDSKPPMTEDELKSLVDVGLEEGAIEDDEFEMISNVFRLDDIDAKDIMIPRIDMVFVQADMTYDEFMEIYREHTYTRYPIYSDSTNNVIGTLNVKDIISLPEGEEFSIRKLLREPHFTFEHKEVGNLLVEMREQSISLIIVLDEYGATSGMITLEDILEEIVGEIRDEYDNDETDAIIKLKGHKSPEYLIDGATDLDIVNEELGLELSSEDYDSIGGFVIEHLDRLPKSGESFRLEDGTKIIAELVKRNRIEKVHIIKPIAKPDVES